METQIGKGSLASATTRFGALSALNVELFDGIELDELVLQLSSIYRLRQSPPALIIDSRLSLPWHYAVLTRVALLAAPYDT